MNPTILITRPDKAAAKFADRLRARLGCGVPIVISPLIRIENTGEMPDLTFVQTLLFTSRNGVAAFLAACDRRDIPCYCVGDATAAAAQEAGLSAVSAAGAAEDLLKRIHSDGITGPCLLVRGEHSTGDIPACLRAEGIATGEVILYRQVRQEASAEALALLQGDQRIVLPLFSPRSARILFSSTKVTAPLAVVALSSNVAQEVPKAFKDSTIVTDRPDAEAMIEAIELLIRSGKPLETGKGAQ